MADSRVVIETKLDTSGIKEGAVDVEKQLNKMADSAKSIGSDINKSLNKIDVDDIADGMSDSFKKESEKIEQILSDSERTQKSTAEKISENYKKASSESSEAISKAWDEVKSSSRAGSDQLIDDLDDVGDKAKGAGESVEGFFDNFFSASVLSDLAVDAIQGVGQAIGDFVTGSLDAAADVSAANAQFEQTFKDLEGTARDALQSVSDETGIAVTRMQDSYTSIYAFTKSIGADSAEALDVANRSMVAAADSAAYYDKSIEDATETLQSFLKGNYENDAALGIACTETTRNTKANELYAKSFNELSESQKVDVLLAMVEAGNEASGALGQAAREANSWTNVQGELDDAMKRFQATLGSPVLEAVIPIIQNITAAINEMLETAASDVLATSMENATQTWQNAEAQFAATSREIEANALVAESYRDRLFELEAAGLNTAESQREYANIVARLNELYPNLNLQIDAQTGLLDENSRAQLDNLEVMKQKALYEAQEERYTELLRSHADAALAVKDAEQALVKVQTERDKIEAKLTQTTGLSVEELIRLYNNQTSVNSALQTNSDILPEVAAAVYALGTASGELTVEEMDLIAQLISLNQEEANLNSEIEKGSAIVSEWDTKLQEAQVTLGDTASELEGTAASQSEMTAAAQESITTLESLREEYYSARQAARESIDAQIGYFDELSTESDRTAADIVANWESQKQAFDQYSANLQKAVDMGLDAALVQQLSDGSEQSMQILNALVTSTDTNVDEINAAFQKVSESRDTVSSTMADVQTNMSEKLTELAASVSESWGEMADTVEFQIADMQRHINSLTGKTVYVNVVTQKSTSGSSGASSSGGKTPSAYATTSYSLEPQVPYLARGAVIPPNAPFLAMLGDQRHGTNIEAPLSTIQEAVAIVMEDMIGSQATGFEAVVSMLREILDAVLGIEVDGETLTKAVENYQHKMAVVKGG